MVSRYTRRKTCIDIPGGRYSLRQFKQTHPRIHTRNQTHPEIPYNVVVDLGGKSTSTVERFHTVGEGDVRHKREREVMGKRGRVWGRYGR